MIYKEAPHINLLMENDMNFVFVTMSVQFCLVEEEESYPSLVARNQPVDVYIERGVSHHSVRSGGRAVERRTVNRGDGGSIPPTAFSKFRQFLHPTFACVFRKRH